MSTSMSSSPPVKGWIDVVGRPDLKLTFQYNPEKVTEKVDLLDFKGQPNPGDTKTRRLVTTYYSRQRTYAMTVTFDTYEMDGSVSVKEKYVDKLMDFLLIDKATRNKADPHADMGRPPLLTLYLGTHWTANGFLTGCSARYLHFHSDYTPARAEVDLTFVESQIVFSKEDEQKKQNPTSAGRGGETSYVVQPGDTLEGIAYRELGNPTRWRALAQANGIENPLDLRPGLRLFIPAL